MDASPPFVPQPRQGSAPGPHARDPHSTDPRWAELPEGELPAPELPVRRLLIQAVTVLALCSSCTYLLWRAGTTLDGATWFLAGPMLLLELHALLSLALHASALWNIDLRPEVGPASAHQWRIAVLIPTFDEPREVLLPTLAAAVALEPEHETWVLDDAARPWLAELAAELGIGYTARRTHEHAKAGNINALLPQLDVDLVAVLDADHVARVDFLSATVGYFDDEQVALVQTPQDFYNLDSFEHVERSRGRRFAEQDLFYRAISAGRNRWNAAFWCGTNAVLRLSALRGVGGVATDTLTEDIHTTIRLHRQGWKSVFHNAVLARGLAAADAEQYLAQRLRWGTGAMQVLRLENPLWVSGLSPMQRVSYAGTLGGWFDSWRALGYLLLAPLTLLTAGTPVQAPPLQFLAFFVTAFVLQRIALSALARGRAPQLWSTVFDVVKLPANLIATLALVRPQRRSFAVTRKGRSVDAEGRRSRMPVPGLLWALLAFCALALLVGVIGLAIPVFSTYLYGGPYAGPYPEPWLAYGALGWTAVNLAVLVTAIHRIRDPRFGSERRAAVRFALEGRATLAGGSARLVDVSLTGALLAVSEVSARTIQLGVPLTVTLDVGPAQVQLSCLVHTLVLDPPAPAGQAGGAPGTPNASPDVVLAGLEFIDVTAADAARLAVALFRTGVTPRFEEIAAQPPTGAVPGGPSLGASVLTSLTSGPISGTEPNLAVLEYFSSGPVSR